MATITARILVLNVNGITVKQDPTVPAQAITVLAQHGFTVQALQVRGLGIHIQASWQPDHEVYSPQFAEELTGWKLAHISQLSIDHFEIDEPASKLDYYDPELEPMAMA